MLWSANSTWTQKSVQHRREHNNICIAIEREGAKAVKQDEEWGEIKLAADSGPTDTVISPGDLPHIELREGAPYKRGVEYEITNGLFSRDLGEKQFVGVTAEGETQSVVAQVVDVSQNSLSVKKCTKSGNRVVFDSEGSYTENKATGKIIWVEEDGNLWSLRMWAKRRPF